MRVYFDAGNRRHLLDVFSDDDPITMQIMSLSHLQPGWYFGEGQPPSASVVALAIGVANIVRLYGATSTEVFPDSDGGILVSGYYKQEMVEIFCRPDGMLDFAYERDDREIDSALEHSLSDVVRRLGALQWKEENSSAFFTRSISAGKRVDTRASHSRTLLEVGFRSSTQAASQIKTPRYVTISSDIIKAASPVVRQSSGDLARRSFHQVAA